jgi:hypothetical protein
MLHESHAAAQFLANSATNIVHTFTIKCFLRNTPAARRLALVDSLPSPRVLLLFNGAELMAVGGLAALNNAFIDLFAGNVDAAGGWPGAALAADWEQYGKRHLFFNSSSLASWRAARSAGFVAGRAAHEEELAYQWSWHGAPRFAGLVRHVCRRLEGLALLEHVRRGVWYGNELGYVADCLLHGPSFVCELAEADYARLEDRLAPDAASSNAVPLDAELQRIHREAGPLPCLRPGWVPVSWACTHLNGTMGMIYTPPELRRWGFARSLGAFQIDSMLARDGFACCHIVDTNTPSMRLAQQLGGRLLAEPVVWRTVYWPGEVTGQGLEAAPGG